MKKQILSLTCTLALMMSLSIMPAMAASKDITTLDEEKTLYTETVELFAAPSKDVVAERTFNCGLALPGGQSGWSTEYEVRFSLPSDAKIKNVRIIPGNGTINQGVPQSLGLVTVSKLRIQSPSSKVVDLPWQKVMDTQAFNDSFNSGSWSLQLYGMNKGPATPMAFGNVIYNRATMEITYTKR